MSGRVLAVDPGTRRIGLAMSDPGAIFASPLMVIDAADDAIAVIARLVVENSVCEVIVGHPVSLSGTSGAAAHDAQMFAERLRERLEIPVSLMDERLTSASAERSMRESGATSREMRGKVDQVAAAILLQSYLDARPR